MYNNILSATTGISPFFMNKGYYLSISVYLEQDIALSHAWKFTIDLNKLQSNLKTKIFAVQQWYQQLVDTYRTSVLNF